jgi:hypothetical protein
MANHQCCADAIVSIPEEVGVGRKSIVVESPTTRWNDTFLTPMDFA